jgi:hypothetical protein
MKDALHVLCRDDEAQNRHPTFAHVGTGLRDRCLLKPQAM